MKIVMLEKDSLGTDVDLGKLKKFGDFTEYATSNEENTPERVKDADIIIVNKVKLNEQTLKDAAHVKLICITATGTDNVDKDYATSRGIVVTNVSGYSTDSVAQHTFALLMYILEKLNYYDEYVKTGKYTESGMFSHFGKPFAELSGMTWGIIGLGAIGKKVADIAKSFGCRVIYYSTSGRNNNKHYEQVDFDTLLSESDIVSIHAPLTEQTRHLMDAEAFRKMKNTAILINVGRGPIIEERALADALDNGEIAGAGLDVLSKEPLEKNNPLANIKDSTKLIITPHMAWASKEARARLVDGVAENMEAYIAGKPVNVVNKEVLSKNVILIGMPGVGKSTIGVLLAKKLGYEFVDSDLLIQSREKRLLKDIIAEEGLDGFLEIEADVNASVEIENVVLATGGSAVYKERAMKHLKEIGTVVYLKVSYEELAKRLGDLKERGVALKEGQTLKDLCDERCPLYEKYADIIVDEEKLGLDETLDKVLYKIRKTS
jgi:glycerate dehydrogenase